MPKNLHAHRKLFKNNPVMNYGLSKNAEIVLSKSIFHVKNRQMTILMFCFITSSLRKNKLEAFISLLFKIFANIGTAVKK